VASFEGDGRESKKKGGFVRGEVVQKGLVAAHNAPKSKCVWCTSAYEYLRIKKQELQIKY